MGYTVLAAPAPAPAGVPAATVLDALAIARRMAERGDAEPIVAADDGWLLTLDETEELAKS